MFKADLHCHTTCSDGSMTPQEIVLHAKQIGLRGLSITDHDTVAAYETAIPVARQVGLRLGVGAEFSSAFRGISVHILAYDFPLDHPIITRLCMRHKERRALRNMAILKKLNARGFAIAEADLPLSHETIGRPHIAEVMVQRGYVRTIKEAFDLYIGDAKPCFDAGAVIATEETIELIHQAGGKAFIAHPHLLRHPRQARAIFNLNFDGIECYYGRLPLDAVNRFLILAKERSRLVSGGSDFHGAMKEYSFLGSSWVDEERFNAIFNHFALE